MIELARFAGAYGAIRILERSDGAREYWQGEALHTLATPSGESLFGHIQAIAHLVGAARKVLVLGGAGGSLATMIARRGGAVTVVDIEPRAQRIAAAYFGLDASVHWITDDANSFVRDTTEHFDAIAVDAFSSRGDAPAHDGAEKIAAIARLLAPGGVLLANFAGIDGPPPDAWPIACTLSTKGFSSFLLRAAESDEGNEILFLSADPHAAPGMLVPPAAPTEAQSYLNSLCAYPAPR